EARAFVADVGRGLWLVASQLGPLLIVLSGYAWMESVIGDPTQSSDAALAAADRALFGGNDPVALMQVLISRPLSEWMSFSYAFYAFLFPIGIGAVLYAS